VLNGPLKNHETRLENRLETRLETRFENRLENRLETRLETRLIKLYQIRSFECKYSSPSRSWVK